MGKRITTKVTGGGNGGIHDTKAYKKACHMLTNHTFTNAQLWHMVLTGSTDRGDYEVVLDRIAEKLRDSGMPVVYKTAYELCPEKGFHRHVFFIIEAKKHKPAGILRYRPNGWLVNLLKEHGLGFYIAPPRNPIHLTRKGLPKKYAYVPKTPGPMLDDCLDWISYAFKKRTKEGVAAPVYSGSRKRAKKTIND